MHNIQKSPRLPNPARHILMLAMATIAGVPAWSATAEFAGMALSAQARVGAASDGDTDSMSWNAGALSGLLVTVEATVVDGQGFSAQANGGGVASWFNADSGWARFGGIGWVVNSRSMAASAAVDLAWPDWRYTFIAGAGDVAFTFDYLVQTVGSKAGLQGWWMEVDGGPEGSRTQFTTADATEPNSAGEFTVALTPGGEYTARLNNVAHLGSASGLFADGHMSGRFDWKVTTTPVPEPGSYALMLGGLAAVGVALRRRSKTRAANIRPVRGD